MRYVLEGSVRKAGDRVRVTAQLIDATHRRTTSGRSATTGRLADIFAVQDEITASVVASDRAASSTPPRTFA